eukprot:g6548.t1
MYTSQSLITRGSTSRNRQPAAAVPPVVSSFASTASHQWPIADDGSILNFASFAKDTRMSPRIRVRNSSSPQIVLRPYSDFQPSSLAFGTSPGTAPKQQRSFERIADSCTDTDDDGHLIQRAKRDLMKRLKSDETKPKSQTKRRRMNAIGGGGSSTITIKTLVEEQIIQPGVNVFSIEYRGRRETASVNPEGKIVWNGLMFDSPSAFSIHVKRLVNPTRKADDGWKSIKYQDKYLDYYKLQFVEKKSHNKPHATSMIISNPE